MDIFKTIEAIEELPTEGDIISSGSDLIPYIYKPSDSLDGGFKEYRKYLKAKWKESGKTPSYNLDQVLNGVKTIYTYITYPLTAPGIFKFTSRSQITYAKLLYAYTWSYQEVYRIENSQDVEKLIPGMYNRIHTHGRYGIWGHVIGDLIYNGNHQITYGPDKTSVVCIFDCDS